MCKYPFRRGMTYHPIGVGMAAQPPGTQFVAEPHVLVMRKIGKNAVSRIEKRWSRAAHSSAQHSDGISDIRSGGRAVAASSVWPPWPRRRFAAGHQPLGRVKDAQRKLRHRA
eukprot:1114132-Pleurochrysis_carterae.AAC.2